MLGSVPMCFSCNVTCGIFSIRICKSRKPQTTYGHSLDEVMHQVLDHWNNSHKDSHPVHAGSLEIRLLKCTSRQPSYLEQDTAKSIEIAFISLHVGTTSAKQNPRTQGYSEYCEVSMRTSIARTQIAAASFP
jgi:hypothetical protein